MLLKKNCWVNNCKGIFTHKINKSAKLKFLNGDMFTHLRQADKLIISLDFAIIHLYDDMHSILEFFSVFCSFL